MEFRFDFEFDYTVQHLESNRAADAERPSGPAYFKS
jgi:hypothetical protein